MIITDWEPVITTYTSDLLLGHLRGLRDRRAALGSDCIAEIRAYDLRIVEAERWLMILNRRATEALDAQSPDGITQREVEVLFTILREHDEPEAHALVTRMWAAIQTMQVGQREAELREAWMTGHRETVRHSGVTDGGAGPSLMTPSESDAEEWAAEYARCKVGG
jgi:hypothetical protein